MCCRMATRPTQLKWVIGMVAFLIQYVRGGYYSSVKGLEVVLRTEGHLLNSVNHYLECELERLDALTHFVDDRKAFLEKCGDHPTCDLTNPILAYKMIRSVSVDWTEMTHLFLADEHINNLRNNISEIVDNLLYAKVDTLDHIGAAVGIQRIQRIYQIPIEQLVEGKLLGKDYGTRLSASDCYELGLALHAAGQYSAAFEWLHKALSMLKKQPDPSFPNLQANKILLQIARSVHDMGNFKLASQIARDVPKTSIDNKMASEIAASSKASLTSKKRQLILNHIHYKSQANKPAHLSGLPPLNVSKMESLCRGEITPTAAEQRPLRCRYITNNEPYYSIAPFKLEEQSLDPFIGVYYDVITHAEIAYMIESASHHLRSSEIDADEKQFKYYRVSESAWLHLDDHLTLKLLNRRLSAITSLSMFAAEWLQVANYGIGGHYGPHYDEAEVIDFKNKFRGKRMLTAMFYLSDVKLGGATAFPFLNLTVVPKKGSLVIWYNLHRCGAIDYRTLHAACPVLKGSKWIANQWLYEIDQVFRRPCGLVSDGFKSAAEKSIYTNVAAAGYRSE